MNVRKSQIAWVVALSLAGSLLSGCGLFRGTPTPLPWAPTATPAATSDAQVVPSPTPTATPTPEPSATPQPTVTSTAPPTPTPGVADQTIALEAPAEGTEVGNPITIRGQAKSMPFEGTLVVRIYDAAGDLALEEPIIASGELGGPATFEAGVSYGGKPGPGTIEVVDISPMNGSVLAEASVSVTLSGYPGGGYIELPHAGSEVTLPIHLLARAGTPGEQVTALVTWDDGTDFERTLTPIPDLDGEGLIFVSLGSTDEAITHPATQPATLELLTSGGSPLASQRVRILAPDDAATVETQVFWVKAETIAAQSIRIPRTEAIGRATLEALLWGPVPGNTEGYDSLIPSPQQILTYPGRGPEWGERVRLQDLRIEDGVAYADFSIELSAHAGGALVTSLIRDQIEATLTQFSTVDEVIISINGVTGVLEP